MTIAITQESPLTGDGLALIEASQTALLEVFEPHEIFSFSPQELAGPEVAFLVARDGDGSPLGCVAMVDCGGYTEVKRLFVGARGRRRGIAKILMQALEDRARAAGFVSVRLETGDALVPAVQLYTALGYTVRGPFGDYAEHPASLFMEKPL